MSTQKLGNIEETMLKALSHNDRATTSELAAMMPETSKEAIEAARAKLEQRKLVEPVPGSSTGQLQLTAKGADTAISLPSESSDGSGGGKSVMS